MVFDLPDNLPDIETCARTDEVHDTFQLPDLRHHVELPFAAIEIAQIQPQSRLRPQDVEEVLDLPEVFPGRDVAVDGQDFVARF